MATKARYKRRSFQNKAGIALASCVVIILATVVSIKSISLFEKVNEYEEKESVSETDYSEFEDDENSSEPDYSKYEDEESISDSDYSEEEERVSESDYSEYEDVDNESEDDDNLSELDTEEDEEEQDDGFKPSFDIMALLDEQLDSYGEMSLDERMEEIDVITMEVSLDELAVYVKDRRKKRGA